MTHRARTRALSLLAIFALLLLLPLQPVSAESSDPPPRCERSVIVDNYKISYIESQENTGNGTTTYVYKVTANPKEVTPSNIALSHWSLLLCDWFFDENFAPDPDDPGSITTPSGNTYSIDTDDRSYPNQTWIKWEFSEGNQLGDGGVPMTDTFTLTVSNQIEYPSDDPKINVTVQLGPVGVETKDGEATTESIPGGDVIGLCGPWADCNSPTSVCFMGLEAKSPSLLGWILRLLNLE